MWVGDVEFFFCVQIWSGVEALELAREPGTPVRYNITGLSRAPVWLHQSIHVCIVLIG